MAQLASRKSGNVKISTGTVGSSGTSGDIILATGTGDPGITRGSISITGREVNINGILKVNGTPTEGSGGGVVNGAYFSGGNVCLPDTGKIVIGTHQITINDDNTLTIGPYIP